MKNLLKKPTEKNDFNFRMEYCFETKGELKSRTFKLKT
jgi:hypothetical protein